MLTCLAVTEDNVQYPEESAESSELAELADDLNPVADLGDTLAHLHSRYLIGLLLSYLVAMGVCMLTVLFNGVRDWLLFAGMFLVILSYIILYIKAHQKKRPILRMLSLVSSEVLLVFWIYILVDRIPERMVFVDGEILIRPALTLIWLPVALLGIIAVALVVHWAYVGRITDRNWESAAT